jgi:hypothetical protein
MQIGVDLQDLLNRIAVIGVAMAVLVLLRGFTEKNTGKHLVISSIWKMFLLFIIFFATGLGHPETLGKAVLGNKSDQATNTVTFDLRLFTGLAAIIVALLIVRSALVFQETNLKDKYV